jgi:hypothetical protein
MIISVREFAANIKRHRSGSAVLLIGYDGGASLLNHTRPLKARDDLLENSPLNPMFNMYDIQQAWFRLYDRRHQFMLDHTTPADSCEPDKQAIDCIAGLVSDNYIHAIVATDTKQVLYEELRARDVVMNRVEASGAHSKTLVSRLGERTLIDGGDLLLTGFWPNMYDLSRMIIGEMQDGLCEFLAAYDRIYCWGWCGFNVQIGKVCPERTGSGFTAIGRYTSSCMTFPDIDIVQGGADEANASNDILYELARHLFPHRLARGSRQRASTRSGGPAEPRPQEPPRVLLADEARAALAKETSRATVSFIGVEGELVRERCARWLSASWQSQGHRPLFYASGDVRSLACSVTVTEDIEDAVWLVGLLAGRAGEEPGWADVLLPHVRRWLDGTPRGRPARETHVALFAAPAVADWAGRAFEGRGSVWIQSYFEATFLAEGAVVEWLLKNVNPLLRRELDHGALLLARHVVGSGRRPGRADWLHWALDQWYEDILREQARRAQVSLDGGGADDDPELTLQDLIGLWDGLCDRYRRAESITTGVDFDVNVRDARNQQGDGDGADAATGPASFSIELRPRSGPQQSAEPDPRPPGKPGPGAEEPGQEEKGRS